MIGIQNKCSLLPINHFIDNDQSIYLHINLYKYYISPTALNFLITNPININGIITRQIRSTALDNLLQSGAPTPSTSSSSTSSLSVFNNGMDSVISVTLLFGRLLSVYVSLYIY